MTEPIPPERRVHGGRLEHGLVVAFIGVDGGGKSSVAQALTSKLKAAQVPVTATWCGFSDWRLLGKLPRLIRRRSAAGSESGGLQDTANPPLTDRMLGNRFVRLLYYLAVSVDYVAQMASKVAVPKGNGRVVICDRYYFDQAISWGVEIRSSMARSLFLRLFAWSLPKPDLVLVVLVPPDIAMARKTDIPSAAYVSERLDEYLHLAAERCFKVIDGQQPIESTVALAFQLTMDAVRTRSVNARRGVSS